MNDEMNRVLSIIRYYGDRITPVSGRRLSAMSGYTDRKCRSLIERLRKDHHIFIVSTDNGYYIGDPKNDMPYLRKLYAHAISELATYRALSKISNDAFKGELQTDLFGEDK